MPACAQQSPSASIHSIILGTAASCKAPRYSRPGHETTVRSQEWANIVAYTQNGSGSISESCVTAYLIRWLGSLMRLEGDLRKGDVMERAIYNALFAAQSPSGRQIRYFTPFAGPRNTSAPTASVVPATIVASSPNCPKWSIIEPGTVASR